MGLAVPGKEITPRIYLYTNKQNKDWIKKGARKAQLSMSAFLDVLVTDARKNGYEVSIVSKRR